MQDELQTQEGQTQEETTVKTRDNTRNSNNRSGGFTEAPKEFKEELLKIDRVTRVTAGGRQLRFRASVLVGDGKGRVGFGTGKAGEVVEAMNKAINDAKKNMVKIELVNGTVPYDIKVKYKSAVVMLHPASPGTGIIAGGAVRKVLAAAGLKDILAKRFGSTNTLNNAKATIKALTSFKKAK